MLPRLQRDLARPLDSCGAHAGRSVVASAPALGAGDREFESPRPDHVRRLGAVITDHWSSS